MKVSLLSGLLVTCAISAAFVFPRTEPAPTDDAVLQSLLAEQQKTNQLLLRIANGVEGLPKLLDSRLTYENLRGDERLPYLMTMKDSLEVIAKKISQLR